MRLLTVYCFHCQHIHTLLLTIV